MSDRVQPTTWRRVTTHFGTAAWVRAEEVSCYGALPPEEGGGNSWVTLCGTEARVYVMESVDQLHVLFDNEPAPTPL